MPLRVTGPMLLNANLPLLWKFMTHACLSRRGMKFVVLTSPQAMRHLRLLASMEHTAPNACLWLRESRPPMPLRRNVPGRPVPTTSVMLKNSAFRAPLLKLAGWFTSRPPEMLVTENGRYGNFVSSRLTLGMLRLLIPATLLVMGPLLR